MLFIKPNTLTVTYIDFSTACAFINKYHRHHIQPQGHKRSFGCFKNNELIGVAVVGRPVSRHLDNGFTWEITRLCSKGGKNVCSKLYSYCVKSAKLNGIKQVYTYILSYENGASLRASNFVLDKLKAGGLKWSGNRTHKTTPFYKKRYVYNIK